MFSLDCMIISFHVFNVFLLNLPSRTHDWPLPRSQHSAPDPRQHLKFHRATGHCWASGKLFMYNMYALYCLETPVHAKISIVYSHWGAKGLVSKQQPTARKNCLGCPNWSKWVDFIGWSWHSQKAPVVNPRCSVEMTHLECDWLRFDVLT